MFCFFLIFTLFVFVFFLTLSTKTAPNGEYSNLVFSSTLGLCPKSSPVKYLYFSKRSLEDKADIFAASLPKSY